MNQDELKIADLQTMQVDEGFSAIDIEFAKFICQQAKCKKYELFAAAAISSYAIGQGNPCANLENYAGQFFPLGLESHSQYPLPLLDNWLEVLRQVPPNILQFTTEKSAAYLIMDNNSRLYFNRFFSYELQVCKQILQRCRIQNVPDLGSINLKEIYNKFQDKSNTDIDYQQLAVYTAVSNKFSIITGGPGTGKTTVAAVLLALKLMKWKADREMNITLCAPTGKAQARLKESVVKGVNDLIISEDIKKRLCDCSCSTIHHLLGYKFNSTGFLHDEKNPIVTDLLVVDEVSMVSLPLMAKLLNALPMEAEVVLLGDKDQLSSVDAGSVLADLYQSGSCNVLNESLGKGFFELTGMRVPQSEDNLPLTGCIAQLKVNHRSDGPIIKEISSAIAQLGEETGADLGEKISILNSDDFSTISEGFQRNFALKIKSRCIELKAGGEKRALTDLPKLAKIGDMKSLEIAFEIVEKFKVLCALRHGIEGVEELNKQILDLLGMKEFAPGVPVMITRNQAAKELYNGDVGIIWNLNGKVRVYFRDWEKSGFRSYYPAELHGFEMVFAMTIHKSQGSGFQNVLIVLPEKNNMVLTRELLYTAITRAEKRVVLFGSSQIIKACLRQKTTRQSGLNDRLCNKII